VKKPNVTIKCVICGHTETIALTRAEPCCSQCFGPVTVERVEGEIPSHIERAICSEGGQGG
jgi:hypothetical protein